jgi:GrpB-like predicted nucleotidyltransferase (UPF0157 family)/predicted acetyltransferase
MIIKETKRLIIRTLQDSDTELLAKLSNDPVVMEHFPSAQSLEEIQYLVDRIHKHYDEHNYTLYAVDLKSSHKFIGFTGLMSVPFKAHFTPAVEIGWRLAKEYWNNGYATEAAQAVLELAFNEHNLNEVVSFTALSNIPSQRVMQKIGLLHDCRDDFEHPKLPKDHPLSQHVLYRLSKESWQLSNEKIRHVELHPYDKNWVKLFEHEKEVIQNILGSNCTHIHHIGSTSIPRIYAKSIIDMMPVVKNLSLVDLHDCEFKELGYQCMGEYGISGRRFYWKSKQNRTHHIHLFEEGNPEIGRHLAFRNYLRDNQDVAQAYSQIKRDLADQFTNDIVSYVEGKSSFIKYIDYLTGHPQKDQLSAEDNIILKPYDSRWKKLAIAEISSIKHLVKLPFLDIQHLGSTAIEGMLAKPIIDIFIALNAIEEADLWIKPLENMGYIFWYENPDKQHLRFFKGMPPYGTCRTHHVHIMEKGKDFDNRIKFRDMLNKSPDDRESYVKLKQELSEKYSKDREVYTEKKFKFVRQILSQAEDEFL